VVVAFWIFDVVGVFEGCGDGVNGDYKGRESSQDDSEAC